MKKLNKKTVMSLAIILVCLSLVFYYVMVRENKEGFEGEMSQDIEDEILKQYMDESLDSLDAEELKKRLAASRAKLAKFGLYPSAGSPDLSKYVLKSQLGPEDDSKCIVAKAEDRDKYIPKSAVPEPKCPGVDMSKYVLKSSIQPEKICPPPKEIDYSRYVLKSTIPPAQKCPPCVCPKVKVSAGLCKACPPPPKLTCPEVKPCPKVECPAPQSCPPQKECQQCHGIKTVKVPIVLKREVRVNERGEIVSETEEEVTNNNNNGNNNNNNNNNNDNNNNNNNNKNNGANNKPANTVAAANETQEEMEQKNNSLGRYYQNVRSKLTTDRHNNNSELLNDGLSAYGKSGLDAYNPTTKPLSDAISSNLSDQNNASLDDNQSGAASLNELMANQTMDNGQKFNIGTRKTKPVAQPHFTSTLEKPPRQILGNNMLTNQPKGLGAKCGPVKFNNVFRRYGVYGTAE